jgi:multiple inositol-polyphosphate phosphatase/2,3-bisphosphoglycerate 3-phosphatase
LEIFKQFRREELENGVETERILDSVEASFSEGPFFSLSELGATEMLSIANRFKRRYPHLFDPSQPVAELIDVLSSDRSRSVDSALNFIRGLYDHPTDDDDDSDDHLVDVLSARLRYNNTIMRLFDECDRYMSGVKNNMEAGIELTKFANGPEMEKLVENFLHRHSIRDMKFKTSN